MTASADDFKSRVRRALEAHHERQLPKASGPSRKNAKPEKEVERACLEWMRRRGWDVNIFEAKSTFDPQRGRYVAQSMKAGTADCMGNMPDGVAVVVEFKAPGKLGTFAHPKNGRQQEFLRRKIESGAFACVTDSVERLEHVFNGWFAFRSIDCLDISKQYLFSKLPRRTLAQEEAKLFDED